MFYHLRSSRPKVFYKKCVLRNFAKITENTCARASLVIKLQASDLQQTLAQVFSCELCEISKNTFSYRTPPGDCFCHFLSHIFKVGIKYLWCYRYYYRLVLVWHKITSTWGKIISNIYDENILHHRNLRVS